ncbi:hypothetical protein [Planctomicrobium sp. SH527]|uniref:hypothetical protein n=1 Tax=Planctomicrobium sp. SH527 TaxID=3448123 RepID=UPI003F5C052D
MTNKITDLLENNHGIASGAVITEPEMVATVSNCRGMMERVRPFMSQVDSLNMMAALLLIAERLKPLFHVAGCLDSISGYMEEIHGTLRGTRFAAQNAAGSLEMAVSRSVDLLGMQTFTEFMQREHKQQPITESELSAIQLRCSKATDCQWVVGFRDENGSSLGGTVCVMDEDESIIVGRMGDFGPTNDPKADAEFIAHARDDVPRLLAEVVRLRRLVNQPKEAS